MACRLWSKRSRPIENELYVLLQTVIGRLMKMLTRRGVLVEQIGQTFPADPDADGKEARTVRPLQAAAVTFRIAAFGADDCFTAANSPLRMSLPGRKVEFATSGLSRSAGEIGRRSAPGRWRSRATALHGGHLHAQSSERRVLGWAVTAALLAACGDGVDSEDDHDHDHDAVTIDTAGRLATIEAGATTLRIHDLDSGSVEASHLMQSPPSAV